MGDSGSARASDSQPSERFPCSSRVFGLISLGGLAIVAGLILWDGYSLGHWTVFAAVVVIGLATWLTMVRPTLHTHDDHVLVRNALTDTKVPWHLVESVEVRQVLVIRTGGGPVHGLAVGRTARQQLRQNRSGDSGGSMKAAATFGGEPVARVDYADFVAQRLDHLAEVNRAKSLELEGLDKRWRSVESIAVAVSIIAFVVLLGIVILR